MQANGIAYRTPQKNPLQRHKSRRFTSARLSNALSSQAHKNRGLVTLKYSIRSQTPSQGQVDMDSDSTTIEVEAVIFDLDGVLIESEEWWDEVRSGMAADHDRAWPADATRAMQGMSTPEWSAYMANTVGIPGTPAEVAQAVIGRMAARYAADLPLIAGAIDAVKAIAADWPVGIASSSPRVLIDTVLKETNLDQVVAYSLSTEQVAAGKPSPAVYQAVAAKLGCEPARTVGVEDSSNGLRSASAAGLLIVAIPNPAYPPAPDALDLADVIIADISLLTPAVIGALAKR